MKIDCYISDGCTSESSLKLNVDTALKQENIEADVHYHRIDEPEAKKMGILGSPTVFINGVDILPGEIPGIS
jgi:protein-disulfide isomerase